MILTAFLVGLVLSLVGLFVAAVRGVELFRQGKRASRDLEAATERLRVSRAQLDVLLRSVETARERTRWLRMFIPSR